MASAVVAAKTWLTPAMPAVTFVTRTDADLESNLPQVRIIGVGGPQLMLNASRERLVLETFAGTELDAINIAHQVKDQLLFQMRGVIGDAVISKISCDSLPARHDYANPAVFMQVATYSVYIRPAY